MESSNLSLKPLWFCNDPEQYELYRAALEWSLVDPIVIEKREDFKSEQKWKDKVEPYKHQVKNLITFCRRLPVTLLADDVGLGKTISAGLVASELISRGRLNKILIVCPKILREQWKEELQMKFGISSIIVTGKDLVNAELPEEIGAVITTYRTATLYMEKIYDDGYDMLILDEAHKLRNLHGTDSAPEVAKCFKKALSDRIFKYVLMLTATPIHNRLWDLYSLVDLLTVARGHDNPFGSPGIFARRFIDDNRNQARQLKPGMQDEFRSIVYGYMSRVRRDDANLHFPQREVQLHSVPPSPEEIDLISSVAKWIGGLDRLTQIGILKTLVSSPEALMIQLNGMAKRKTVPEPFAQEVRDIVSKIKITAKLQGLNALIDKLQSERPLDWRVVIFTTRIETQTTIQTFLEAKGIKTAIINGSTGASNQETIHKFKKDTPDVNVIISTEAGSEGVNLQVANVLVNYDLPWNPMIVEQRIGRIQRLGSKFEKVCIFNIVLKGTFEEYVVGKLIEKLQMAASAIGDIDSLLQASGVVDGEDNVEGFEDKILSLVLKSLQGKNVEETALRIAKSIEDAKQELQNEERNINQLLGKMEDENGPVCPSLPVTVRSMDVDNFVLKGLKSLGAEISYRADNLYYSILDGREELIRLGEEGITQELKTSTLYSPGSPAFERLTNKLTSTGLHRLVDTDIHPIEYEEVTKQWTHDFGSVFQSAKIDGTYIQFSGAVVIRVRVTVAHDSYERLVEVLCTPNDHFSLKTSDAFNNKVIDDLASIGVNPKLLIEEAYRDIGISEFSRFYSERLVEELKSVGSDLRKRKKIEDDFTPRFEFAVVGIDGAVNRKLEIVAIYNIDSVQYRSNIKIIPSLKEIISAPEMKECMISHRTVPVDCLGACELSHINALKHLLIKSDVSGRIVLPENSIVCSLSGKRVVKDEVETSSVSNNYVISELLKISEISGRRAEPTYFHKCELTGVNALKDELAISEISSRLYRSDEKLTSAVSGKTGHKSEFIFCTETGKPLLQSEAEKCEITGKIVIPGLLEKCDVTNKFVLPTELEKSAVSGKKALKKFFVFSNISGARLLEEEGIKSVMGNFCVPAEARKCSWSNKICHPEDLRICELTSLSVYFEYMTNNDGKYRLEVLGQLLDGTLRKSDRNDIWDEIKSNIPSTLDNRVCKIETAQMSPNGENIAICIEIKTLLGLRVRHGGFIYGITDKAVVGRVVVGKRLNNRWVAN